MHPHAAAPEMLVCPRCGDAPGGGATCPRDGRLLVSATEYAKAPGDRYLGTRLAGKYPLVGILGVGGMSTVYRAVQEPVGREVAIKVVSAEAEDHNAVRERFSREAQVIARLQHPNIVTLYDFGVEPDGTLFMVQELVEGEPLSQKIADAGPLEPARALRITLQVLAALADAHAKQLVHRDMKPENIMLAPTSWGGEQAKVLDFGIARLLGRSAAGHERLTRAGVIFGTPHYMSPEQVAGEGDIGLSSDLYSLAIVVFEMLTGEVPFPEASLIDVLVAHRVRELPRLPAELAIPRPVEEVLRRAAAKDPAARFAHAGEMLRALEAALGLGPGGLPSSGPLFQLPGGADDFGPEAATAAQPLPGGSRRDRASARGEVRSTLVLDEAEPSPSPAEEPAAAWSRACTDALHYRPTLVVAEDGLPATVPVQTGGSRQGSEPDYLDEAGELPAVLHHPLPGRPFEPLPSDHYDSQTAGAETMVLSVPLASPPTPQPTRARSTPRPSPVQPAAPAPLLPWVLLGVGLVTLVLALLLLLRVLQG